MSANWKRWLLSSGAVLGLACGDSDPDGVVLDDGGNPVVIGDSGLRDGGSIDGSARRDGSVRRDGSAVTPGDGGEEENCGVLMAQIRDFTPSTNPDFEKFSGSGATTGIVESTLDSNHLPVFKAANGQVTSKTSFDQWYRNVPDVNQAINVEIPNMRPSSSEYVYSSSAFFPIDGKGFGNSGNEHNFNFTTQIPTNFTYHGGEVFEFEGDDDLWIFVNDKLALDLGGLHSAVKGTIDFDAQAAALGIVKGQTYRMDIFHAERHTTQSNFKIRTTISCFTPVFI